MAVQLACGATPPEPVEIALNEEICSHCRMAVSQRQFAAEVVAPGGAVDYFDDIGCLARWWNERRPPAGSGVFVVDYESGRWLEAGSAHYVQADRLNTPMRFGLVAFGGAAPAEAAAAELEGRLLGWDEVLREAAP